eukprot:443725_1
MTQYDKKEIITNANLIEVAVYGYIHEQEQTLHLQIPLEIKHLCVIIIGSLRRNTFVFDYNKLAAQCFNNTPTPYQLFFILNKHSKESIFLDLKYIDPEFRVANNQQYILSHNLKHILSYNTVEIENFYNTILNCAVKHYKCFMTPTDMRKYHKYFIQADKNNDGVIDGNEANKFFSKSRVNRNILAKIWELTRNKPHIHLNEIGFCVFFHIVINIKKSKFYISYWKNKHGKYKLPFYLQHSFLNKWFKQHKKK